MICDITNSSEAYPGPIFSVQTYDEETCCVFCIFICSAAANEGEGVGGNLTILMWNIYFFSAKTRPVTYCDIY